MAEQSGTSRFFALVARMRYIQRWGLMRNTVVENVQEHSCQVAMVAHALALLSKHKFGRDVDANLTSVIGLYHDAEEVFTGDIPTPVKNADGESAAVHSRIADVARAALLGYLPEDRREHYANLLNPDKASYESKLVKAADKICAYLKCVEETKAGNSEFEQAGAQIKHDLEKLARDLPEITDFLATYLGAFELSLDQLHSK